MLRPALFTPLVALATACAAAPASQLSDADAVRFFNAQGCKTCHAVDELRIGPSYRMIALRYAEAPPATVERLSLKVLHGGAGAWGTTPMISHPDVPMEDAERIVRWILANRRQPE